jgi:hypothetical protein
MEENKMWQCEDKLTRPIFYSLVKQPTQSIYHIYTILVVSFFHTSNNSFKWIEGSLTEPQWIRQQKFTKLFVCNAL